jgi:hypothetical protein
MRLSSEQVEQFAKWLVSCGAEVVAPTSDWEIIRVIAKGETAVAYRNKRGDQSWPGMLADAWAARKSGFQPQLGNPQKALRGNKKARLYELADRDGWGCWYCSRELDELTATIEEICPRQIGGPIHIGNQCLACPECNQKAANKSVVEKVRMLSSSSKEWK